MTNWKDICREKNGSDVCDSADACSDCVNRAARMTDTTQHDLVKQILADHALWVEGNGGKCADLRGANLRDATGNMREIRTMHIDTWPVTYTADTLQIGCQRHSIEKWRKWDTEAGRKLVGQMDANASAWADRNLGLILQMIDANPATPTGHEEGCTHD